MSEQSTFRAKLGDRSLFPDLQRKAYLNHAAISPPSLAVRKAAQDVIDTYASIGVSAFPKYKEQRERFRGKMAGLLGVDAAELGFVQNTTMGVTTIAMQFPWQRGDRVVCFEGEFPANVTPWQRAAELHGLDVVMLPLKDFELPGGPDLGRLEETLRRGRVRVVATSAVQFQTGLRMPLKAMADVAHTYGARLFVDGIQAVGIVPMDLRALGVDFLSAGSHKWMMGLEGCAVLYAREELARELRPHLAGWLSHEDGTGFLFGKPGLLRYDRPLRATTDVVEGGAPNSLGLAALEASVDLLRGLGVDECFEHVTAYLDRLEAGLTARGFTSQRTPDAERRSGILSVVPPDDVDLVKLADELNMTGIAVSTPDGRLRFAPHWPNAQREIDIVLDAVDQAVERSPKA